jgi:fructose-bisphosphate aldolase, class II
VRAHLNSDANVNDPRRYLAPARTAIADAVAAMITAID